MNLHFRGIAQTLVCILLLSQCGGFAHKNNTIPQASALLGDYETVFYTDADLLSKHTSSYGGLSEQDAQPLRTAPFSYLTAGLGALGKDTSSDIMKTADSVMGGAKGFRGPEKGIGPVRSQVCYVLDLKKGNSLDFSKYFRSPPVGLIGGYPIFSWSAKLGEMGDSDPEAPTLLFAVQIRSSYLLVSNNKGELTSVAAQLSATARLHQTPLGIGDWEFVRRYSFWAHRRYRHDIDERNRHAAGMTDVTREAQALIVAVDFATKTCVVRFMTSGTGSQTPLKINSHRVLPEFRLIQKGVWQSEYAFGDEHADARTLYVMMILGFGSYI